MLTIQKQAIDALVDQCSTVAAELAGKFKQLEQIRHRNNVFDKPLALMTAFWNHDDIMRLVEQLDKYQSQLVLRMLFYLNMKAEAAQVSQSQRFDTLESKIVEVLTVSEDKLNLIQGQNSSLRRELEEAGARDLAYQDKTLAAILTLENGKTSFLTPRGTAFPVIDKGGQKVMAMRSESGSHKATAMVRDFAPIQDEVLRCLYFRQVGDRFDSVHSAHQKTFSWIFDRPPESDVPFSPFVEWLETGCGCYWINGKAGSGKSTLMKYIYSNPGTTEALNKWAKSAGHDLGYASFFFWNLGSPLQKTQEGLLRSLLYEILRKRPYLISVVMPELWMAGVTVTGNRNSALEAPSYPELLRWFRRLLDRTTSQLRLFFLIDGIDEYDGDYFKLIQLISDVSSNKNAKFLISSRPIPICVDSFQQHPHLRLQDLTRGDITQYAEDFLKEKLQKRYGDKWEHIIKEIVEKSCGVILWVVLVVRSVLTGVQNYDSIEELTQRLDELPSDLKKLYAHMLQIMPIKYRMQASRLLQICLQAQEVQKPPYLLTPLQLYFAEQDDQAVIKMIKSPLKPQELDSRNEETEGRMRSRCCGLLETRIVGIQMQRAFSPTTAIKRQHVDFIHRTVVEFLRTPEVWEMLSSLTKDTSFHPSISLLRSCVLLCKTHPTQSTIALEDSLAYHHALCGMEYASLAEMASKTICSDVLSELDTTLAHHWKHATKCTLGYNAIETHSHWTQAFSLLPDNGSSPLATALHAAAKPLTFHSLAVYHGLPTFIRDYPTGSKQAAAALLHTATRYFLTLKPWPLPRQEIMTARCAAIAAELLRQRADPNAAFGATSRSAWDLMLEYAALRAGSKEDFQRRVQGTGFGALYKRLLVEFVDGGADVNARVRWKEGRQSPGEGAGVGSVEYSALRVVDVLFYSSEGSKEGDVEQFRRLMVQKGAVAREWKDGKLISGPLEPVKEPNRLKIPDAGHRRTRSADSAPRRGKRSGLGKLGGLFTSWVKTTDNT